MKNSEKYYRRAYNALQKLINVYKDGYNHYQMNEFRKELILGGMSCQKIMKEEQLSILFAITTALLGLNKESIEKTEKFSAYKKTEKSTGMSNEILTKQMLSRISEFNSKRTVETPFDIWLSVIKDLTKEHDSSTIMKKIRNGILHGNFELLLEPGNIDYTSIKIKSYFEAELLNLEFEKYIFEYFSNLEGLGLTETMYTYNIKQIDIKDKDMLRSTLEEMLINEITYKNIRNLGEKTPEEYLMEARGENETIDVPKFIEALSSSDNFSDIKGQVLKLNPATTRYLESYIEKTFGQDFYKLNSHEQSGIITTHLNLVLSPKRELSNWLTHFWYLYSTLTTNQFNSDFFSGDEYAFESCYPALLILKAYLIMYRIQCKDFDELDYNKIDFLLDGTIEIISANKNNPISEENSFALSIEKEQERNKKISYKEAFHKVICDVVRNSLAHGNVNVYISPLTLERKIDLTDTDPKTGRVRQLRFEIDSFNKFVSSDAFLPKNCYNKEESNTLSKDI